VSKGRLRDDPLRGPLVHRQQETGLGDDRLHSPGLLGHAVGELDMQVGPQDRKQNTRHAATGAHVEHPLTLREVGRDHRGIGHVAGDEFLHVGVPREVEPLVPRPEARRIRGEPLRGIRGYGQTQPRTLCCDRRRQVCLGRLLMRHLMNSISR
jgi:hypothetical protein